MRAARLVMTGISTATGACFAALAGLSVSASAFPVRRFHLFSVVVAAVSIVLGLLAFRAALAGDTDETTVAKAFRRAVIGALLGLLIMVAFLFMFRGDTQSFLAHALGKPSAGFTMFRLLLASVLLGFGTGFVLRVPRSAR